MADIKELKLDAEEAKKILEITTRKNLKDLIFNDLQRIEREIARLAAVEKNKQNTTSGSKIYTHIIRNYSWDQSDKFMKIYISLDGIHNINKDNVQCNFTDTGLDLKIIDLGGKNHELKISRFAYAIKSSTSYFKIKTDLLVIFISKMKESTWEVVTAEEKKISDNKKKDPKGGAEKSKDSEGGLMDLMKQMYDDGDDEMRRMLNKTWYESQNKKNSDAAPGFPEMGGLNL